MILRVDNFKLAISGREKEVITKKIKKEIRCSEFRTNSYCLNMIYSQSWTYMI